MSLLRSFTLSLGVAGAGMPTPRLLCLRTLSLSFTALGVAFGECFDTSAPELSSSNSSEVRFFARCAGDVKELGGDVLSAGGESSAAAARASVE